MQQYNTLKSCQNYSFISFYSQFQTSATENMKVFFPSVEMNSVKSEFPQ